MDGLRAIARTFWIGGLWVIGIIVAPVLFRSLDTVTAGMVAGKLFAAIAWVGWCAGIPAGGCGMAQWRAWHEGSQLLADCRHAAVYRHQSFCRDPIIAALKLQMNHAAEGLFGGGFATWHAISSLIYLVQSLMGLAYILRRD
jgi:hypothetical protein